LRPLALFSITLSIFKSRLVNTDLIKASSSHQTRAAISHIGKEDGAEHKQRHDFYELLYSLTSNKIPIKMYNKRGQKQPKCAFCAFLAPNIKTKFTVEIVISSIKMCQKMSLCTFRTSLLQIVWKTKSEEEFYPAVSLFLPLCLYFAPTRFDDEVYGFSSRIVAVLPSAGPISGGCGKDGFQI
jgi:hypothetical protein